MALIKAEADSLMWFDPKEGPFELTGFEWIHQDSVYKRLPVQPDWEIREAVDQLANHTAGGQIRFKTNSKKILIKVKLRERSGMYHMPATGQSGFDLYQDDKGTQRFVRTSRFPHDSIRYQVELLNSDENRPGSFTINFPLYNGVDSLQIGLEKKPGLKHLTHLKKLVSL